MGIDCPDIGQVIHWGLPSNIEDYAQETGRAGRNGQPAEAVLFGGKIGISHNGKKHRRCVFQGFQ